MSVIDQIFEKAKQNPQKVAFPEALNEKIVEAAYQAGENGYIYPVLIGNPESSVSRRPGKADNVIGILQFNAVVLVCPRERLCQRHGRVRIV